MSNLLNPEFKIREVAERIRATRESVGLTPEEMAEKVGMTSFEYLAYEGGAKDFSFSFIYKFAGATGVEITDLMEGESPHINSFDITRKGEGLPIARRKGLTYQRLAPNFKNKIGEPFLVTIPYVDEKFRVAHPHTHEGQEMDIVVSGQLKVAPEHCMPEVLDKMGKPHIETYLEFSKHYFELTHSAGKEQYLVPYLMSSHPGSTLESAIGLAEFLKSRKIRPEQVQDFYPTPGTISTCMFYTELDPYTMKPVYVAKDPHEKALQRALLQYYNPKNSGLVLEALKKAGRYDLIGTGQKCLVKNDIRPNKKERAADHGNEKDRQFSRKKGREIRGSKQKNRKNQNTESHQWIPQKKNKKRR